jgi:transcriptional regulator of arginine metabolism
MPKTKRQLAIKDLIAHHGVSTQDDLCRMLKRQGFDITQATLSRDLKELAVLRVNTPEGPRYALNPIAEERRLKSFIGYEIEQMDANEYLIVVKTLPGRAQGVAEIIDSLQHPDILGTLAGDNTIFVTPSSTRKLKQVFRTLQELAAEEAVVD